MLTFLDTELLAPTGTHITAQVTTLKAITLQTVAITGVLPINQQPAIATTDQAPLTHTKPTLKPIQLIQDIAITIDTPIIINHIAKQALAMHTGAIGLQAIPGIVLLEPIILGTIIRRDLANI